MSKQISQQVDNQKLVDNSDYALKNKGRDHAKKKEKKKRKKEESTAMTVAEVKGGCPEKGPN